MEFIILLILLAFLIFLFWLRIKIFRPHWLANIVFFAFVFVMSLMSDDTSGVSTIGAIVCTLIAYFWAKRVDKKKAANTVTAPPNPVLQPQSKPAPQPQSNPQPVSLPQTLTTCVRCSRPLRGPKCSQCSFDHTAEPVYLLCLIPPQKLQIKINTSHDIGP